MSDRRIVIAGGGAAGFIAAITCAELNSRAKVILIEKGPQFLSKVRISGGGRCNVTHACFDPRQLSSYYPRGGSELLAPFQRFHPRHTIDWFESRGVRLKTESDGRVFPVTDSSQTIIECLLQAARRAKVELITQQALENVKRGNGGFNLTVNHGDTVQCERLMLATGGCRVPAAAKLAVSLGHTLETPVPSLFTFHIAAPWLGQLAGISMQSIEVSVPGQQLRERGAVLVTHTGLSGPAILKISAWGARSLNSLNYDFPLRLNWLPHLDAKGLDAELESRRATQSARLIINSPISPVPARLWEQLVLQAGISSGIRWAQLSRSSRHKLTQQLIRTEFQVVGKSLNRDEFVTCGGVRLSEVDFKTMESRICTGLFFGGELLDIDGLTGGFNFQSAWTTGWLAGKAMSQ